MPLVQLPAVIQQRVGVGAHSIHSVGTWIASTNSGPPGSATWPAANRALFMPLMIQNPSVATGFWVLNGSSLTGNIDLGIYDENFVRLVSTGAKVTAGAASIQYHDATDTLIPRGRHYLAISVASASCQIQRYGSATLGLISAFGVVQMESAHPLPTTATPATIGAGYVPICGVMFRTTF